MARFDDLDYHITFPTPVTLTDDTEQAASLTQPDSVPGGNTNDDREPVIILLGWAGCIDRYLSKYADIYDMKGCLTIRYTSPNDVVYIYPHLSKPIARKVLEIILEYDLAAHKIIFHVFSNGGCLVYQHVSELVQNDANFCTLQICGVIFDSAPVRVSVVNTTRALSASIAHVNIFTRWLYMLGFLAFYTFGRFFSSLQSLITGTPYIVWYLYDAIKEDSAQWPQLYLYSTTDKLCSSTNVSDLVKHRRDKGFDVSDFCWEDTEHVRHFITHREAYIHQCHRFLDKCLANQPT